MPFLKTPFEDLYVFEPIVFEDDRGYFYEAFNSRTFEKETGITKPFVQDNQAFSTKGVLRGLHFQIGEYAQAKLVRVVQGEVLDVVVDLRKDKPTFGQSFSIFLSDSNKKQLYVPRGFAHGYLVHSETAEFFYKCDNYYHQPAEGGIRFDDSDLNIDWKMPSHDLHLSPKDLLLPFFATFKD